MCGCMVWCGWVGGGVGHQLVWLAGKGAGGGTDGSGRCTTHTPMHTDFLSKSNSIRSSSSNSACQAAARTVQAP